MGGGIAIILVTEYPEVFNGAILFAPQTSSEASGVTAMLMRSGIMQTMYSVVLKFALMFPSVVRSLVEMSFSDKEYASKYDVSRISDPLSIKGTGGGITIMTSHAEGPDFEKISQLNIPSVVITAKQDKVANADNLNAIIESLGNTVTVYECEKGGHMMMEYDPVLVAEKTLPVMEKCA